MALGSYALERWEPALGVPRGAGDGRAHKLIGQFDGRRSNEPVERPFINIQRS